MNDDKSSKSASSRIKFNKKQKIFIFSTLIVIFAFAIFLVVSINAITTNDISSEIQAENQEELASSCPNTNIQEETTDSDSKTDTENSNDTEKTSDLVKDNNETINKTEQNVNLETTTNDSKQKDNDTTKTSIPQKSENSSNNTSNSQVSTDNTEKEQTINITIQNVNETLYSKKIDISDSITAFEALEQFSKENNIKIKYTGSSSHAYVTSIDGLKERDYGGSSGWMYKVNNSFPTIAAGSYKLSPGDSLVWIYSKDGGKDIGQR